VAGVAWALIAAVGFGVTQTMNRKANQTVDAYRTAFGLLVGVEILLVAREIVTGEFRLLAGTEVATIALFAGSTFIHYLAGWTLLAMSQQRIGVARTGALISAAPLVGTLLAARVLDEGFGVLTFVGVVVTVVGVAMVSMSRGGEGGSRFARPWHALTVAVLWGISPQMIRLGLRDLDAPVLGLTIGLGISLVVFAVALTIRGAWRGPVSTSAIGWMAAGGVSGAVAISAQWISFSLTTVAVAITVQQLAVLVVVALVPVMFKEPLERLNALLLSGTFAMLVGSAVVVLAA
jgi:DME family drug/metabolite transporter